MRKEYRGPVKPGDLPHEGPTPGREAMRRGTRNLQSRGALGTCALLLALSGCSIGTTRYGWLGSYAPAGIPNAQDCVPFGFGQPTKFACAGGKVYTAHQLKELREKAEKTPASTVASAGY